MQTASLESAALCRNGFGPASFIHPLLHGGSSFRQILTKRRRGKRTVTNTSQLPRHGRSAVLSASSIDVARGVESKNGRSKWTNHWWPVQFLEKLDAERPNEIHLLGERYVIWKSENGEWMAAKDIVSTRTASSNGGRSGSLGSFNEWRNTFKGGTPLQDLQFAWCRGSLTTYPCKEFAGCLWIWPDSAAAPLGPVPLVESTASVSSSSVPISKTPAELVITTACQPLLKFEFEDEYLKERKNQAILNQWTRTMTLCMELSCGALLMAVGFCMKSLQGTPPFWAGFVPLIGFCVFGLVARQLADKCILTKAA